LFGQWIAGDKSPAYGFPISAAGAKALFDLIGFCGTAEAVPCHKTLLDWDYSSG
jgi:hypothetical protein